jgi:hypothetical protein
MGTIGCPAESTIRERHFIADANGELRFAAGDGAGRRVTVDACERIRVLNPLV